MKKLLSLLLVLVILLAVASPAPAAQYFSQQSFASPLVVADPFFADAFVADPFAFTTFNTGFGSPFVVGVPTNGAFLNNSVVFGNGVRSFNTFAPSAFGVRTLGSSVFVPRAVGFSAGVGVASPFVQQTQQFGPLGRLRFQQQTVGGGIGGINAVQNGGRRFR